MTISFTVNPSTINYGDRLPLNATTQVNMCATATPIRYTASEGTITGKINLTGTAPAPQPIDMSQDANCKAKNPNATTETVVAKDGKLQNAFVYIKDGTLADGSKIGDWTFKTPDTAKGPSHHSAGRPPDKLGR